MACARAGLKSNGRLKRGYRWAKGRKKCPIPARKTSRRRRRRR
jgi:hypothetical protein